MILLTLLTLVYCLSPEESQALCALVPKYPCDGSCPISGTCQNNKLTSLYLTNLTNSIPDVFGSLASLETLSIIWTYNNGTIPPSICKPPLKSFILQDTGVRGTIPLCLFGLITLKLNKNFLSGTIPKLYPYRMIELDLSNNLLSGPLPEVITNTLSFINLASNSFTGTVPTSINKITTLFNIDISDNKITGTVPSIQSLTSLTYINLSRNYLNGKIQSISSTRSTVYYHISQNTYDASSLANYHPYSNVVTDLRGNRIETRLGNTQKLYLYPQDIDDCLLKRYVCPNKSYCSDGWSPRMGYTCSCLNGYEYTANGCIDVNECLRNKVCTPGTCVNTEGSYECCDFGYYNPTPEVEEAACVSCYSNYSYLTKQDNISLLPTSQYLNQCFGSCLNGVRIYSRSSLNPACPSESPKEEPCQYPCVNTSNSDVINSILTELKRGDYIKDLLGFEPNTTTRTTTRQDIISYYTTDELRITCLDRCGTVLEVVKVISNEGYTYNINNDTVTIITSSPETKNYTVIIVVVVFGVGLICLALVVVAIVKDPANLLPREIAETVKYPLLQRIFGKYTKSNDGGYYYYNYQGELPTLIDGYTIQSVQRVYNPTLVNNFVGAYVVQEQRLGDQKFNKKRWTETKDTASRTEVYAKYQSLLISHSWYDDNKPHIITACHATDVVVAEKICETGFANLSLLDKGWYGKGIYFTSYSFYCKPYLVTKKQPSILIAYILPGNTYPVVENSNNEKSLLGAATVSGYQSHYVVTSYDGKIYEGEGESYDEIVIPQESQILPMYIVRVSC